MSDKTTVYRQEVVAPGSKRSNVTFDNDFNVIDDESSKVYAFKEPLVELYLKVAGMSDSNRCKSFFWKQVEPTLKALKDELSRALQENQVLHDFQNNAIDTYTQLRNLKAQLVKVGPFVFGVVSDDLLS